MINIMILLFFKYGNMMLAFAEGILSVRAIPMKQVAFNIILMNRTNAIPITSIVLPLAISFVVFQSISYLVDVYTEKISAEDNLFVFALYELAFFQLVQGPIIRYPDIAPQLRNRELTTDQTIEGIRRFCQGLGKKVIIANSLALVVNPLWEQTYSIGTMDAWVALILYAFQIYYDFSGYSDMAVGLGKMLGFDICENFNRPYISKSVQEFWRRWHISLSSWFKDYLYIPLGGNRKGKNRTLVNILIVFLVTWIWHGANWTFILWGLWYALFLILERVFLKKVLDRNPIKIINWAYTFMVVILGWASYTDYIVVIAVIAAILFMGPVQEKFGEKYSQFRETKIGFTIDFIFGMMILVYSVILIINGSYSPSIYAGF